MGLRSNHFKLQLPDNLHYIFQYMINIYDENNEEINRDNRYVKGKVFHAVYNEIEEKLGRFCTSGFMLFAIRKVKKPEEFLVFDASIKLNTG